MGARCPLRIFQSFPKPLIHCQRTWRAASFRMNRTNWDGFSTFPTPSTIFFVYLMFLLYLFEGITSFRKVMPDASFGTFLFAPFAAPDVTKIQRRNFWAPPIMTTSQPCRAALMKDKITAARFHLVPLLPTRTTASRRNDPSGSAKPVEAMASRVVGPRPSAARRTVGVMLGSTGCSHATRQSSTPCVQKARRTFTSASLA